MGVAKIFNAVLAATLCVSALAQSPALPTMAFRLQDDPIHNDEPVPGETDYNQDLSVPFNLVDSKTGKYFGQYGQLVDLKDFAAELEFITDERFTDGGSSRFGLRDVNLGEAGYIRNYASLVQAEQLESFGAIVSSDFKWFWNFGVEAGIFTLCTDWYYVIGAVDSYSCIGAYDQQLILTFPENAIWWRMEPPAPSISNENPVQEEVIYSNPFLLQEATYGLFVGNEFEMSGSDFNPMTMRAVYDARIYSGDRPRFALRNELEPEHFGFFLNDGERLYTGLLDTTDPGSAYTYSFRHTADGKVAILNDYDFGDGMKSCIGIDPSSSRFILVSTVDPRAARFHVRPVEEQQPAQIVTLHRGFDNMVWSNGGGNVILLNQDAMEIELSVSSIANEPGHFTLRDVRFGEAGYIGHFNGALQKGVLAPQDLRYSWYFEQIGDGTVWIRSDYDSDDGLSAYIGVEPWSALIIMLYKDDVRLASWHPIITQVNPVEEPVTEILPTPSVDQTPKAPIQKNGWKKSPQTEKKETPPESSSFSKPIVYGSIAAGAVGLVAVGLAVYKLKRGKSGAPNAPPVAIVVDRQTRSRRLTKKQQVVVMQQVEPSAPPMPSSPTLGF